MLVFSEPGYGRASDVLVRMAAPLPSEQQDCARCARECQAAATAAAFSHQTVKSISMRLLVHPSTQGPALPHQQTCYLAALAHG